MVDLSVVPESSREIGREVARLEENARHAQQSQFEQYKVWRTLHLRLGIPSAVLSAVSGTMALATALHVVAGVVALLSAAFATTVTALGAERRSERACNTGNAYRDIQIEARQLLSVDLSVLDYADARERLKVLTDRYSEVSGAAEPVFERSYQRARANLEQGGQSHEIDTGGQSKHGEDD